MRFHSSAPLLCIPAVCILALGAAGACGTQNGGDGDGELAGGDRSDGVTVFCADRVDDDEDGADEDCPATQPADAAPGFDCTGTPPDSVLFSAALPSNEQVAGGCVFIYQAQSGAFYAAVSVENGANPQGPMGSQTGLCSYDFSARRHLFFTSSPVESCEDLQYTYPDQLENQLLSNSCRKMVRNIAFNDPSFEPDIQFLPGGVEDQRTRVASYDTAEVACLRINNQAGAPYRQDEVFVTQATATLVENANFVPAP